MPIMDGYSASLCIRNYALQNGLSQPSIIALTGQVEDEYIQKCWQHKMNEVVSKPAKIEVIQALLKEKIIII